MSMAVPSRSSRSRNRCGAVEGVAVVVIAVVAAVVVIVVAAVVVIVKWRCAWRDTRRCADEIAKMVIRGPPFQNAQGTS